MRHNVYGKKLGRNKNQRKALFKSLVQALLIHGSIQTSETKAKAVKGLVDKIITQAKSKNTQRLLQTFLNQKEIREKLIKEIAPALKSRQSGYTSMVKLGQRKGDGAMMVRMSLLMDESKVEVSKVKKVSEVSKEKEAEAVIKKPAIRRTAKKVNK